MAFGILLQAKSEVATSRDGRGRRTCPAASVRNWHRRAPAGRRQDSRGCVRLDRRAKPLLSAPVSRELQRLPAVTKGLDEQRTRTPKPRTRREAAERQPSSANASYHRRPPLHDAEPREARCVCGVLPRRQRLEGPAEPPAVKADELHHRLAVAPVV